ncbi:hypothetical protein H710_01087 [Bartonella bacilliformis Ver097]|uniref:Uncharacterized protein n=1 Tax=Bartonella bacilliformis Ver097 TaxID=1293911 RepID=A0A072R0Z2_BARBA|nr:hypothetical protein H710_01087 [Bartonella bacilliformis Ver097]
MLVAADINVEFPQYGQLYRIHSSQMFKKYKKDHAMRGLFLYL